MSIIDMSIYDLELESRKRNFQFQTTKETVKSSESFCERLGAAHRLPRSPWIPTWAERRMRAENMQIYMRIPDARFLILPGRLTARFTHLHPRAPRPMGACHSFSLYLSLCFFFTELESLPYVTINETCLSA